MTGNFGFAWAISHRHTWFLLNFQLKTVKETQLSNSVFIGKESSNIYSKADKFHFYAESSCRVRVRELVFIFWIRHMVKNDFFHIILDLSWKQTHEWITWKPVCMTKSGWLRKVMRNCWRMRVILLSSKTYDYILDPAFWFITQMVHIWPNLVSCVKVYVYVCTI